MLPKFVINAAKSKDLLFASVVGKRVPHPLARLLRERVGKHELNKFVILSAAKNLLFVRITTIQNLL